MSLARAFEVALAGAVREHPGNRDPETGLPYFRDILFGYASARDPLFAEYKRVIGPFHWTPEEALAIDREGEAGTAATVAVWILPIATAVRASNRREDRLPSREWALTRHRGEKFNEHLRRTAVDFLEKAGHRAVAPALLPQWARVDDPGSGLASSWSERHAAYAAGLGTFSLSDGFITRRGIAHRIGSIVTDAAFPTTTALPGPIRRYCAHYAPGGCGLCIPRCPAGAITPEGHDKYACQSYSRDYIMKRVGEKYGVDIAGCGLCQTGVPCESAIPGGAKTRAATVAEPGRDPA